MAMIPRLYAFEVILVKEGALALSSFLSRYNVPHWLLRPKSHNFPINAFQSPNGLNWRYSIHCQGKGVGRQSRKSKTFLCLREVFPSPCYGTSFFPTHEVSASPFLLEPFGHLLFSPRSITVFTILLCALYSSFALFCRQMVIFSCLLTDLDLSPV